MSGPELLSTEEIEQMNAYLEAFPPLVEPPADLPFFHVRRIAATLLSLTTRLDNSARRENALVKELDAARAEVEEERSRRQDAAREVRRLDKETRLMVTAVENLTRQRDEFHLKMCQACDQNAQMQEELLAARALLRECRDWVKTVDSHAPGCRWWNTGHCACGRTDLLQRIEAELREER